MKKCAFVYFFLIITSVFAQEGDFETAVKYLANTKPTRGIALMARAVSNPQTKERLSKEFSEQLVAIAVIQKAKKEVNLNVLFPYLDFTERLDLGFVNHPTFAAEGKEPIQDSRLQEKRTSWPVFAIILDMPNAEKSLEAYAMNGKNPLNYRLDAYQILAYFEGSPLKKIKETLKADIAHNESLKDKNTPDQFLDEVEHKRVWGFRGGVNFE